MVVRRGTRAHTERRLLEEFVQSPPTDAERVEEERSRKSALAPPNVFPVGTVIRNPARDPRNGRRVAVRASGRTGRRRTAVGRAGGRRQRYARRVGISQVILERTGMRPYKKDRGRLRFIAQPSSEVVFLGILLVV